MRFRFCGDLDCPDWVLAEINTLSKISSVKMKMLCQLVAVALSGDSLDEEKAKKIVSDAKLDEEASAMEACVSVLSLILTSSTRYNVEPDVLASELEQLGLPKEHASALSKIFSAHRGNIKSQLATQVLRLSSVSEVRCEKEGPGTARLTMTVMDHVKGRTTPLALQLTDQELAMLTAEMKAAKKAMEMTGSESGAC